MKRIAFTFLILVASSAANAGVIKDFTGDYDVKKWTQVLDGGSIDLSDAPFSILEISSNFVNTTDPWCCPSSATNFTIDAIADATIAFDWEYSTVDANPSWDPFGWLLDKEFTQLTDNDGPNDQKGTVSFDVLAGQKFGFSQQSVDSIFGSASTTISNFSAVSAAVPEPATLSLLGLGLLGLGLMRRRRTL